MAAWSRCDLLFGLGSFLDGGSGLGSGSSGFLAAATRALLGCALLLVLGLEQCLIEVNEFDEAGLGVVTETVAELEDAGVATGTVGHLSGNGREEFLDGLLVLEVLEDEAA